MRHALWIGGPPGSGKTTIAVRLVRRHGLRWYGADTRTWEHRDRALAAGHPAARRWEAMRPAERATGTPEELLGRSLHAVRGPMVVEDVRRLPESPLVVAEGTPITPALVASGAVDRGRAVWLLPTPALQRARLEERALPAAARRLYALIAAELERSAQAHGVTVVADDGSRAVDELVAAVERQFADSLAAGPLAEGVDGRRALLREANEAVVGQVLAYFARPWARGDPGSGVCPFLCECADRECDATVPLAVTAIPAEPLLARGHG